MSDPVGKLIQNNLEWAGRINSNNPNYFANSAIKQEPKSIWIAVSPEIITQSSLGEIFVLRNIANQFKTTDLSTLSLVEYAVKHLKVKHIIVCGHYGCGGVGHVIDTANNFNQHDHIDNWLQTIKDVYLSHNSHFINKSNEEQKNLLVELNVKKQVFNISTVDDIQKAWRSGDKIVIHGLVYNLKTGLLKNLDVDIGNSRRYWYLAERFGFSSGRVQSPSRRPDLDNIALKDGFRIMNAHSGSIELVGNVYNVIYGTAAMQIGEAKPGEWVWTTNP
ncbi:8737_t:CDS:2 [Racocetra persica]|uniref:8737_t:CDS:1 n=1 Tax=Racocetra persica TaxID=160502 RepID=A0ACA9KG64_9GLOM|nr:8737_t:CDS:2 [Racocetra persica]